MNDPIIIAFATLVLVGTICGLFVIGGLIVDAFLWLIGR